TRLSFEFSLDS
ncbi:hypothetical protein VN97_g848, partial [Penicillium thymicola]